jgi:predicted oxidoreductase
MDADAIIVGAGLAGLVAVAELAAAGRRVIVLDQEPEQSLGGQAFWSLGGLFLVNSPEQRRLRIHDSRELAEQDWFGTAGFDRPEDHWPRRWAQAYLDFATFEKRAWLHELGIRFFPLVGWAERGGSLATGHGNSVPRFHLTWGTGPGVLEPFLRLAAAAVEQGRVEFRYRHRVDSLTATDGTVTGVRGTVLEDSSVPRGQPSSRQANGEFALSAAVVLVSSGGVGGNPEKVRELWPERLGPAPTTMVLGVPAHVDGRMLDITAAAGGRRINGDRMWHYTEGLRNFDPIWPEHGIRILPGPSSLWLDARGQRFPAPLFPGFDTLGTLAHITASGFDYSWFVLNERILEREFTLSGSEQNPDITGRSVRDVLKRGSGGAPAPVAAFLERGEDFCTARSVPELAAAMNALTGSDLIDTTELTGQIHARDREIVNRYSKDQQITAIRGARSYLAERAVRVAKPHRLLDPKAGRLIAVRLNLLSRKTLGGLETDLSCRVLTEGGQPLPGLYAAGEAAGFGGGGMHGYRSLEGTFLGGCLFSGRAAGRAMAEATAG